MKNPLLMKMQNSCHELYYYYEKMAQEKNILKPDNYLLNRSCRKIYYFHFYRSIHQGYIIYISVSQPFYFLVCVPLCQGRSEATFYPGPKLKFPPLAPAPPPPMDKKFSFKNQFNKKSMPMLPYIFIWAIASFFFFTMGQS